MTECLPIDSISGSRWLVLLDQVISGEKPVQVYGPSRALLGWPRVENGDFRPAASHPQTVDDDCVTAGAASFGIVRALPQHLYHHGSFGQLLMKCVRRPTAWWRKTKSMGLGKFLPTGKPVFFARVILFPALRNVEQPIKETLGDQFVRRPCNHSLRCRPFYHCDRSSPASLSIWLGNQFKVMINRRINWHRSSLSRKTMGLKKPNQTSRALEYGGPCYA